MRENENEEEKIDKYYIQLKNAFVKAHQELIDEMYINKTKKNNWWKKEMSRLKANLK